MPMGMPMQAAPAVAAAPAAEAAEDKADAPVEEAKPEKKIFNVVLKGFDAAQKIKLIKELRGLTTIGLKEAKDLVGCLGEAYVPCEAYLFALVSWMLLCMQ